jgi:3-deoxy-D-manno-octulosonate 8-phosphate phosphatase KdsC-like HAD superfamily phosphatase
VLSSDRREYPGHKGTGEIGAKTYVLALEIPVEQMATIGDMPSDVLMIRKSGVSIAMGNASWDVQREATFVTTSNEDEGFAHGIVNEIYFPHVDSPNTHDLQFLITDGESFCHEERRDLLHQTEYPEIP